MKIVINNCHGGFGLSSMAERLYQELAQKKFINDDEERACPFLVQVVEQLGEDASDSYADLKIVEVPDDVNWCIEEYDGKEWVAEVHRTWS